jgi:hypothetical protein
MPAANGKKLRLVIIAIWLRHRSSQKFRFDHDTESQMRFSVMTFESEAWVN